MSLGPIVTGSGLAENKVIGSEELAERTGTDRVHGTGLKIHQDSTGHVATTGGFVVVDVDSLKLKIGVSVVSTGGVNTMLVRDDFPKLGTNLVTTLAGLNVNDFSHFKLVVLFVNCKQIVNVLACKLFLANREYCEV
jgi:hypothetical protein